VRVSKRYLLVPALLLSFCAGSWAQVDPCNLTIQVPGGRDRRPRNSEAEDARREEMRHDQQKKLNEERQASLKKDSEELFNLASQLKASVDKTTQNTLSVDVVRTAQQIEKLAKSVREKMKGNLYCDLQAH
jgi:hypothetical protein